MNAGLWHRIYIDLAAAGSVIGAAFTMYAKLQRQVTEIHLSINSKMDQLLELTRAAAHAAGKLEGMQIVQGTEAPPPPAGSIMTGEPLHVEGSLSLSAPSPPPPPPAEKGD